MLGCGSPIIPVSGTVTLDGKPLEGAGVGFHPRGEGPLGSAVTNMQGEYAIESINRRGLPPGTYRVTISKKIQSGFDEYERVGAAGIQVKSLVPAIYGDVEKTPLSAEVQDGKYRFDFELDSHPK
jgi:hypothetical protein